MFKKLSEKPVAEVQKEQVAKWKEEDLLHKCVTEREGAPSFVFYEGPPTANGKPGIHHVMARTLKDSINRYKTMQGYQVKRKGGWDTHGLPVEIEVEKQLGFSGKQDIEAYGIKEFNEKCRESVFTYTNMWTEMSDRMAYMADMDNPYITLDNDYIETGVRQRPHLRRLQDSAVLPAMRNGTCVPRSSAGLQDGQGKHAYLQIQEKRHG